MYIKTGAESPPPTERGFNMKLLKYKGITFDDYAQNEDGTYWAEICKKCAEKHFRPIGCDLKEGGCRGVTCFVEGCFHNDDNEEHFYLDFDSEFVSFEDVSEDDNYDKQYI